MRTNDIDIGILVSEDIWANMKIIVLRLQAQVLENPEVGFFALILLCQTEGHWDMELKPVTL